MNSEKRTIWSWLAGNPAASQFFRSNPGMASRIGRFSSNSEIRHLALGILVVGHPSVLRQTYSHNQHGRTLSLAPDKALVKIFANQLASVFTSNSRSTLARPAIAKRFRSSGVFKQLTNCSGGERRVAWRDQKSILSVIHQFGNPGDPCRNNGHTCRHSLHENDRKPLSKASHDKNICVSKQLPHLPLRLIT